MVELVEYDPVTKELVAANRDEVVEMIQGMVDRRLAEHAAAERTFPATTDCDRVTDAFARLEAVGVLATEDEGYTQSDLRDEMWERVERAPLAEAPPPVARSSVRKPLYTAGFCTLDPASGVTRLPCGLG